jgi:hypothetical protein
MGTVTESDEIPFDEENPPPKEPHRVKTFDEAIKEMRATPEEEHILNNGGDFDDLPERRQSETLDEAAARDPNRIPEWVKIPPKMKIPDGQEVGFMLFRAKWTAKPQLGDRQVILWPLTDADEKLAMKRTRGESGRSLTEASKQTIRAIDGVKANWTGAFVLGNVDTFWNDIGPKCRQLVMNFYLKTHTLEVAEQLDFFANCLVVRRMGG